MKKWSMLTCNVSSATKLQDTFPLMSLQKPPGALFAIQNSNRSKKHIPRHWQVQLHNPFQRLTEKLSVAELGKSMDLNVNYGFDFPRS